MSWSWSAGPCGTGPAVSLAGARNKKLTVRRGRDGSSSELSFDLTGRDRAARVIDEFAWDAWLLHDETVEWRGRIAPENESGTLLAQAPSYSAYDYRELLARRIMSETATNSWTGDPGDVFWTLLSQEQARPGSNLGIVRGIHQTQASVAGNVERGKTVREAADVLAGLGAGADWDITPTSLLGLRADWWTPTRDRALSRIIRLGHAAITYQRQIDAGQYANRIRLTGQPPEGGGAEPAPVWIAVADIATRPEGAWDAAESTSLTTTAALNARAPVALAERQIVPVSYSCALRRGWWKGRQHLWVGDTVQWLLKLDFVDDRGRRYTFRDVDVPLPVEEMSLDFDQPPAPAEVALHKQYGLELDPGEPKVSLTLGQPNRNAIAQIARRVLNLERR